MDPYVEVCKRFEDEHLRYVIVGVFGINFYSQQTGHLITTADCDILIPAQLTALRKALRILVAMGFSLKAGGEPLQELDPVVLKGILRARALVRGDRKDARVDLCTQIAGTQFVRLWRTQRQFLVEGVAVRVGALDELVASKQSADRPKDKLFLEQHKEVIQSMLR